MNERRARALARSAAIATAILLPAALLAWGGYARRWLGDDGFINLRVVSQLLAGNGFVFNAGERSEVVTSPGWVAVLWLAGALGMRLEDAAWSIALALGVLGLVLSGSAALASRSVEERAERWYVPFGLLAYACLPPAWDYATSGLEHGLGLAFQGTVACLTARAVRPGAARSSSFAAAFALSFAPLIRPDYELLALPLLGLLCLRARGVRRRLELAGLGLSAGLAHEIFRMGYFGSLVPNTALAKEAFELRWTQGLHYLWNSVGVYWLLVPLGALGLGLVLAAGLEVGRPSVPEARLRDHRQHWGGPRALPLCLFAGGLLHLSYIVGMGGDFMHARLLLPGLFALCSAVPVLGLGTQLSLPERALSGALCAVLFGWCTLCSTRLRVSIDNEFGIGDERGWYADMAAVKNPTRIEDYESFVFYRNALSLRRSLQRSCPQRASARARGSAEVCPRLLLTRAEDGVLQDQKPSALLELSEASIVPEVTSVVASRPLGIVAAVLGLGVNLVDYYGLADPIAARLTLTRRRRPGHEKAFDTVWQAARYAAPQSTADELVRAARHALGCGTLAELSLATREPLTPKRFLRNMKLAIVARGVRIPQDAREAEAAFCASPASTL